MLRNALNRRLDARKHSVKTFKRFQKKHLVRGRSLVGERGRETSMEDAVLKRAATAVGSAVGGGKGGDRGTGGGSMGGLRMMKNEE